MLLDNIPTAELFWSDPLSKQAAKKKLETFIVTADKDMMQLVGGTVRVPLEKIAALRGPKVVVFQDLDDPPVAATGRAASKGRPTGEFRVDGSPERAVNRKKVWRRRPWSAVELQSRPTL